MKAVVGLGNPGAKYKGTRHNVGFEVIDELARRAGIGFESAPADALIAKWRASDTLLVKPLTFMNLSGQAIGEPAEELDAIRDAEVLCLLHQKALEGAAFEVGTGEQSLDSRAGASERRQQHVLSLHVSQARGAHHGEPGPRAR